MKVGIFGLGYVGLTTAACLLRKDIAVIGYEISADKRASLGRGECPLSEPGVEPAIIDGLKQGLFTVEEFVDPHNLPDIFFISVGTPSDERGGTNLVAVDGVFEQLASIHSALSNFGSEIILRSTVPPGTMHSFAKKYPDLFASVPTGFYPEFLREGTAIKDFENPPQTVVGLLDGCPAPNQVLKLFAGFGFEYSLVDVVSTESLKFACNAFHALKVTFANEMGRLVSSFGGNAEEVMRLFMKDTQLNISSKYLLPGAPYGGSCLPKDTRSIRNLSVRRGLNLLTVSSCEDSNQAHFNYICDKIAEQKPNALAVLGLSFKKDTDDFRESPTLEILYRFAAKGNTTLKVHDFLIKPEKSIGVNRELAQKLISLPSIVFSNNLQEALADVDLVVIMHTDERYERAALQSGKPVINVARWKGL